MSFEGQQCQGTVKIMEKFSVSSSSVVLVPILMSDTLAPKLMCHNLSTFRNSIRVLQYRSFLLSELDVPKDPTSNLCLGHATNV